MCAFSDNIEASLDQRFQTTYGVGEKSPEGGKKSHRVSVTLLVLSDKTGQADRLKEGELTDKPGGNEAHAHTP